MVALGFVPCTCYHFIVVYSLGVYSVACMYFVRTDAKMEALVTNPRREQLVVALLVPHMLR